MTNPERTQDKDDAAEVKNFTRTANMLIFGYRELSPQEKWLYVCLKHLCGARGTRYLALRFVSEQTGISVGALSSSKDKKGNVNEGMIRHLHNAGLIHAEVKKKDGRGNPLYHITITDVWALNQAFFIERNQTRSDFGQDENETSEPVRISDAPVQISDKPVQISDKSVRNSDEPVRNPVQLQDYSKTTNKITDKTDKQEGTYSAGEQNSTAQNVATATTPARHSQDEPYRPDFSAAQQPNKPASQEKSEQDSVAMPELSTLTGTSPQASAKVEPKQPVQSPSKSVIRTNNHVPPPPSRPAQNSKPQLSLLGGQVRESYEIIRACRLRMTKNNIKALNTLGELDGMDFVSLKETIELIEAQNMVKERNIPIDLQALASEDGYWRFDKWYQVVLRNRKQQASKSSPPPPTSASLPSFSDMTDEEFYADARNYSNLRKGNQNVRTAHAR